MTTSLGREVAAMVEPDRVHRRVYADPAVFELEMEHIFNKVWTYVGHDSQVPNVGDYWTVQIGRQPMLMVRHSDRSIRVLYNRCPHRGALLYGDRNGNVGKGIICSYHAWQFDTDGRCKAIPLDKGYAGTRLTPGDANCNLHTPPRVEVYRGFVFASLAAEGPSLLDWLGEARIAFDDMCDRAPAGEVEVVPTCFRVIQQSNWKIFLENQLDALHPSVTHESTGRAAGEVEDALNAAGGHAPLAYHFLSAFATPITKWDDFQTLGYKHGHCILTGYMGLRPRDPDTLAYEAAMEKAYGKARMEEILGVNIHHVLIYPGLSVQSPLQQLRVVRPLSVDKTLTEIWHFRLKGAPEAMYRRALGYYNLVNSPSTMVNADDLWNFWKCHKGLESTGGDWVSFHRNAGQDPESDGVTRSVIGTSEQPMRNQFKAWSQLMSEVK